MCGFLSSSLQLNGILLIGLCELIYVKSSRAEVQRNVSYFLVENVISEMQVLLVGFGLVVV